MYYCRNNYHFPAEGMLLSICIPTYNRADTLIVLLNSIIRQSSPINADKFEIVICDNDSMDNTTEIVGALRPGIQIPIRYIKHSTNIGLIKNVLSVVDHASGKFCWLVGSDDLLEPGSINRVLDIINQYPQVKVLLPQFNVYDSTLTHKAKDTFRPIYRFNDEEVILNFEPASEDIIIELGYLSILIFDRQAWNNVPNQKQFEFNNYYHISKIIRIAQQNPIMILQEKLVGYRGNNDSVRAEIGVFERTRILIEENEELFRDTLDETSYRKNMKKHLIFHIKGYLINVQLHLSFKNRVKLFKMLYRFYKTEPYFWKSIALHLFIPAFIIRKLIG